MAVIELLSRKEIVSQSSLIKKFLSNCIVKDNDAQLQQIVIDTRLNYSLKIPDAFIAATAIRYNLLLVSGDPVFKRIKELDFLFVEF